MDKKNTLIERLLEEITQLKRIIAEQALTIEMQGKRIAELEKRLGKNISNSSKPPASDGLSKKLRTNSLRLSGQNPSTPFNP